MGDSAVDIKQWRRSGGGEHARIRFLCMESNFSLEVVPAQFPEM